MSQAQSYSLYKCLHRFIYISSSNYFCLKIQCWFYILVQGEVEEGLAAQCLYFAGTTLKYVPLSASCILHIYAEYLDYCISGSKFDPTAQGLHGVSRFLMLRYSACNTYTKNQDHNSFFLIQKLEYLGTLALRHYLGAVLGRKYQRTFIFVTFVKAAYSWFSQVVHTYRFRKYLGCIKVCHAKCRPSLANCIWLLRLFKQICSSECLPYAEQLHLACILPASSFMHLGYFLSGFYAVCMQYQGCLFYTAYIRCKRYILCKGGVNTFVGVIDLGLK